MAKETINFTKSNIDQLSVPEKGRRYVYDTKIPSLCISITTVGTKSFQVYRKVMGRPRRVTLGRYPAMTPEQARNKALRVHSELNEGKDPVEEKRQQREELISLATVWEDCLALRGPQLRTTTIAAYQRFVYRDLKSWAKKPLGGITKDMVSRRHRELSKKSSSSANSVMRLLRALFNFANDFYESADGRSLFPENPVRRLSSTRSWNKEVRRQSCLSRNQIKPWLDELVLIRREGNPFDVMAADYLEILLLTGMRRREAAQLRRQDIDFKAETFTVLKTKNGDALTLLMTAYLKVLFSRRCIESVNEYVFDSPTSDSGFINDPRRVVNRVRQKINVEFTLHDLRRTFLTIAESLDTSAYALKRLVNHRPAHRDVTAGYIIMDVERLRRPLEAIHGFMYGRSSKDNVVAISAQGERLQESTR